jgi:hypothetical protein
VESYRKLMHAAQMENWTSGYTQSELDSAQDRYGLRFPPDLIDLLLDRQPLNGYNWKGEDKRIREMLAWPMDMLTFDVEHGSWWSDWGERPATVEDRQKVLADVLASAPALIPLYSHRFIPEVPNAIGNPVFSMHGFDTIYYGSNLENYFDREFGDNRETALGKLIRRIPFWSDLAEDRGKRV